VNPLKTQYVFTKKPASTLSVKRKQKGSRNFQAIQNGNPYTIMEFGNKEVPQYNPLIGHRYKNCSNEILLPAFLVHTVEFPLAGLRWNIYS